MRGAPLVLLAAVCMVLACSNTPKEFTMKQNGDRYVFALSPPTGRFERRPDYSRFFSSLAASTEGYDYMRRYDEPVDSTSECRVVFRAQEAPPEVFAGFVLHFHPDSIITMVTNERTGSTDTMHEPGLYLEFHPLSYHKMYELKFITFSSRYPGAELRVLFRAVEPRKGGRATGTIEYAKLPSTYWEFGTRGDTEGDRLFELWNFPFDVVMQ